MLKKSHIGITLPTLKLSPTTIQTFFGMEKKKKKKGKSCNSKQHPAKKGEFL